MADFLDFLPLFQETEETVRARMDADVNAGLSPSDEAWVDTRAGGFYYDVTQVAVQEIARTWDAMATEIPAAAYPSYAWGEYLDDWASVFGLTRKDAIRATSTVLFSGPAGTLLGADIQITAPQTDPEVDPPIFRTTEGGVITTALTTPTGLAGSPVTGSGGSLAAATYWYKITARNEYGETLASTEISVVLGGTGKINLSWTPVAGATSYGVYRSPTTGIEKFMTTSPVATFSDQGAIAPGIVVVPVANTTGGKFRADIRADEAGTSYNVGAGALTFILTPVGDTVTVLNEAAITSGTDEESDTALRERVLLEFEPGGAGNVADYKRWALAYPGVGQAKVTPIWSGPGTVKVTVTTALGDPVDAATVAGLQAQLDPLAGLGAGLAPIGHTVTVDTPTILAINVVATVTFQTGYSLDGASGTIATRAEITAALAAYIDSLTADDDVIYKHVEAQFFGVRGVLDISGLTVNAGAANVTVSSSQVASLGTTTLT